MFTLKTYNIMDKNISIEQFLENKDNNIISRSKKSPLKAILLILSGLFFLILNSQLYLESQSFFLSPLLFLVAGCLIIWGIIEGVFRKNYFVFTENKQKLKTFEYYFDNKDRDKLISILTSKNFSELKLLKPATHDGLKIKLLKTDDARICFSQVIAYVPYEFINATPVYEHVNNDAKMLIENIQLN